MNFDLNDDQRLLAETVDRFVAERYPFEVRARGARNRSAWREMAELGLLGLPFAESDGGFGGGGVETMLVMQALGRGLVLEPYWSAIILAGGVLRHAGNPSALAARAPRIVAGEHLLALAHSEPGGPRHALAAGMPAMRADDGWTLDGEKIAVIGGDAADAFIVSANAGAGTMLLLVPRDAPGLTIVPETGYDGHRLARLRFERVAASEVVAGPGEGEAVLAATFDETSAALCAEAVGIMADTLDMTAQYLRTRTQFGVAIGSFQALQHRAVDMLIALELARSMATLAALSLTLPADERHRAVAMAKVQIGRSARLIGEEAVQVHGAIGLTTEYKVGHALKRLTAIDTLLGDADHHLDWLAAAGPPAAA